MGLFSNNKKLWSGLWKADSKASGNQGGGYAHL